MTILVTGGAGYIGSHVAALLCARGEQVVVLDNLVTGFASLVPAQATFIQADTTDQATLEHILTTHKIEAVLHFAASLVVPESVVQPLAYYRNNVGGTLSLLTAMQKCGVQRLIFSSTAAVYGMPQDVPITEQTPTAPISPYGMSKLMSERMIEDAGTAHGLQSVRLRYFNVAGADPQGQRGQLSRKATHLIKLAVGAALGGPGLTITGTDYATPDGTCIRDYIHVSDLAAAHLAALDYLRAGGASVALNCGYGRGASVREVVQAVRRVAATDFPVSEGPRRAGDPPVLVADNRKLLSLLNWTPHHDNLDEIVTHALAWERKAQARGPLA